MERAFESYRNQFLIQSELDSYNSKVSQAKLYNIVVRGGSFGFLAWSSATFFQ